MFDKTFFKFAVGFTAIIALSIGVLALSGYINHSKGEKQTASLGK